MNDPKLFGPKLQGKLQLIYDKIFSCKEEDYCQTEPTKKPTALADSNTPTNSTVHANVPKNECDRKRMCEDKITDDESYKRWQLKNDLGPEQKQKTIPKNASKDEIKRVKTENEKTLKDNIWRKIFKTIIANCDAKHYCSAENWANNRDSMDLVDSTSASIDSKTVHGKTKSLVGSAVPEKSQVQARSPVSARLPIPANTKAQEKSQVSAKLTVPEKPTALEKQQISAKPTAPEKSQGSEKPTDQAK